MSSFSKKKTVDMAKKKKIFFCDENVNETVFGSSGNIVFMPEKTNYNNCCGCFDCWYKTPALCRYKDDADNMGMLLANCSELTVITKSCYGCCSPFTKGLLDRGLTYFSPYFLVDKHMTRLKSYYKSRYSVRFLFYGDIPEKEKRIANSFAEAYAFLVAAKDYSVCFFNGIDEALKSLQADNKHLR